jgi:hypothetical protein
MRRTILLAKARVDGSPEIAITGRQGHATYKIDRMSQDYVTAGRVMNDKIRLFKGFDDLPPG